MAKILKFDDEARRLLVLATVASAHRACTGQALELVAAQGLQGHLAGQLGIGA